MSVRIDSGQRRTTFGRMSERSHNGRRSNVGARHHDRPVSRSPRAESEQKLVELAPEWPIPDRVRRKTGQIQLKSVPMPSSAELSPKVQALGRHLPNIGRHRSHFPGARAVPRRCSQGRLCITRGSTAQPSRMPTMLCATRDAATCASVSVYVEVIRNNRSRHMYPCCNSAFLGGEFTGAHKSNDKRPMGREGYEASHNQTKIGRTSVETKANLANTNLQTDETSLKLVEINLICVESKSCLAKCNPNWLVKP